MVCAVVEKHAETLRVEVVLISYPHGEIGAEQAGAGGQDQEKAHFELRGHRLGLNYSFSISFITIKCALA